jgi:DNA-binding CsgD family transcriptional regulator/tetratricopeptide (TPR) repeat protein
MNMELLERDGVLDELHRLLRQAADGRGRLLLLGGEAGVGKTSVLRRFSSEAATCARVLLGHCDPLSTPRALGPLFDIDHPLLNRHLAEDAPRDTIFRAVLACFASTSRPTLLAIEDAHWADEATLDLLRFLGRRLASSRALVIVTFRNDEIGSRHPLRHLLGDLATTDTVQRLALAPLTIEAVKSLANGSGLDGMALYERTRGNPFFVTEVLGAGGGIPPNVRDAVLARASRLDAAAWAVLEAAAVIGSPVDLTLLDAVTTRAPGDLEACLELGMLLGDGPTLSFRHELAREAILTAISPPRRVDIHRAILRTLEEDPSLPSDAARLAHHAEEAGDAFAVLRHAPDAARKAALLGAHREAADQYARALRFATVVPPADRALLLEARSYACYLTSQVDEAMTARQAALETWTKLGNVRKVGENRCHLATLLWAQARIVEAEREAEAAVALMEQVADGPELAMAQATLARLLGPTLRDDEVFRLGEQAIALAQRFGDTESLIDARITVGEAMLARSKIESGLHQLDLGMRLASAAGLDGVAARAYISLGHGFAECGRSDIATEHFERGIRFCAERDLDLPRLHLMALLARSHLSLGNWDEAGQLSSTVLSAHDVAPGTRFVALLVAGTLLARRGESGASPLLDEAQALATASGCVYFIGPTAAARAEAAYVSGSLARMGDDIRDAFALAVERGHGWYASELAYWRWKSGESVEPVDIIGPFSWQVSGDWQCAAAAWEARSCPYEAAWARAEADDEAALRAALVTFEDLGAVPAAAHTRCRLRQIGARRIPRGPQRATRATPAGLTSREVDVARLLAEDLSNKEIASRLYLSPRTIENHVASILNKLGATTRGDAVVAATELGIVS